jgi:hypothetical protein
MTPTIPPITRNYVEIALNIYHHPNNVHQYLCTTLRDFRGRVIAGVAGSVKDMREFDIAQLLSHLVHGDRLEFVAKIAPPKVLSPEEDALADHDDCCPGYNGGLYCTRSKGHSGDHVAAELENIYRRWPQGPRLFKVGEVVTILNDPNEWISISGGDREISFLVVGVKETPIALEVYTKHPQALDIQNSRGGVQYGVSGWWFCEGGEEG